MCARITDVTFCVDFSARRTLHLTNLGTSMSANRLNLTIVAILAAGLGGLATAASPLEDATYEATKACGVVGAINIESCGDSVVSSPAHSAARKAVIRLYTARTDFMRSCQKTERYIDDCPYMADWHFYRGFNRALSEEPENPQTLQSSRRQ